MTVKDMSSKLPKLRGSRPVDGLARRVTARGEPSRERLGEGEQSTPFQTWKWYGQRKHDLTGQRRGLLTAVGAYAVPTNYKSGKRLSRDGPLWVVRCDCGVYLRRRAKRFRAARGGACTACRRKGLGGL